MTKTLNQIIFFFLHQNQNIFFSNTGNQNIFLEKNHNPPPPPHPLQVKWSFPYTDKLFHIKLNRVHLTMNGIQTLLVINIDCTGSCK